MESKTVQVPREAIDLYNRYIHGEISRRTFMDGAKKFAMVGGAAALVEALMPNYAAGQVVAPNDPRIRSERATVPSPNGNGSINGLLVRPANAGTTRLPAILVIHENRGLNPHIEDIARRFAVANFMAFATSACLTASAFLASAATADLASHSGHANRLLPIHSARVANAISIKFFIDCSSSCRKQHRGQV
jgi:carboxymethylenebutenolidase